MDDYDIKNGRRNKLLKGSLRIITKFKMGNILKSENFAVFAKF